MFKPGDKVRIIKPPMGRVGRSMIAVVGSIGEVIKRPPPSKWDTERSNNFVWVRISLQQEHGVEAITDTPYGLRDMSGSVWLLDEDDFDDEQRSNAITGYDPDCVELVKSDNEPNPFEGYQEKLIHLWADQRTQAHKTYMAEMERLHKHTMGLDDERPLDEETDRASWWAEWERRQEVRDAHREAGSEQYLDWNRCLREAGLEDMVR